MIHYNYLVAVLVRTDNIQSVDCPVKTDGDRKSSLRIDIVTNNGGTWTKVIARKSKALDDGVNGETSFGTKSILDHAASYIKAADENPFNFKPPKVQYTRNNNYYTIQEEPLMELEKHKIFYRLFSILLILLARKLSMNYFKWVLRFESTVNRR